jgi:tetratricopeptide (TPR) repeat protein
MSRVFLVQESALRRQVVLKVLSPELSEGLSAERFAREILLLARLQHPNIVPILTAGTADGLPWYTMPFIQGQSLRARLDAGRKLPQQEALGILRDVARALSYAHSLGVVHRDIKPENILLSHDAAVVADFGVAKAMAAAMRPGLSAARTTLTQSGTALGTPAYMAPEQASGDPAVDHRADLYAWGLLAYEMLSGAHPFGGRASVQAMVTAHLVEQPRPLRAVAPEVSAETATLVMQCLAKNPADRPADARALLLGGSGEGPVVRRSRRRAVVLAGLLLTAAAAAAVIVLAPSREASAPPTGAVPATKEAAFDAYLRGKVRVGSESREGNDSAIAVLRLAVAGDPSLAAAHATLARAYAIKAFYFAPDSLKKQLTEEAEVSLQRAFALDRQLPEAYQARGLLLWTPTRRFPHEEAVQAYRQALALDSTLDEAHHQIALVYLHVGLFDQAETEIVKALALNPGNTLARFRRGVIALYRGDYDRAREVFVSTPLELNPSLWAFQMATALFRLGREPEATDLIDRFLRESPQDEGGVGHSVRAMMLAKAGNREEAEAAIARSVELGRGFGHFHHTAYNIASAYALLGNRAKALEWLQSAAETGFPCYPLFLQDKLLDGIRRDPAFLQFMAGLKRDWEGRKRSL